MKQRTRIYYSAQQNELMWERWKKGDTLHDIGRLFDRGHSSIQRILQDAGGFRPAARKRPTITHVSRERSHFNRLSDGVVDANDRQPALPVGIYGKSGNKS